MPKLGMEPIRRAATINAALECICEHGIDNITLDMVAAKAGFSKGIVAYYFKSKKNLILESLKEFLAAYSLKIGSSIKPDMNPLQMIRTVVEVALPPLKDKSEETLNVSTLDGADKIRLPQERIARLFVQFIAMAAIDNDLKIIMRETYARDVEGISLLMQHVEKMFPQTGFDSKKSAYALFVMIYGLSFFRVNEFMPSGCADNREIALEFIDNLFAT